MLHIDRKLCLRLDMETAATRDETGVMSGLTGEGANGMSVANEVPDPGRPDMTTVESRVLLLQSPIYTLIAAIP